MSMYFEILGRAVAYGAAAYGAGYTLTGISAAHRRPTREAIEKHQIMVISEFADINATLDDEFSDKSNSLSSESKHRILDALTASESRIRDALIDLKYGSN